MLTVRSSHLFVALALALDAQDKGSGSGAGSMPTQTVPPPAPPAPPQAVQHEATGSTPAASQPPTTAPTPDASRAAEVASAKPKRTANDLTSAEHEAIDGALRQGLLDAHVDEATIADDLILGPEEANAAFKAAAEKLGLTLSGKDGTENVTVGTLRYALRTYYADQKA